MLFAGFLFDMLISVEYVFFWLTRSEHDLQALATPQLKQFILRFSKLSKHITSFLQSTQSCFRCGIVIPSNDFVQSIENLPEIVFPSNGDMNSVSFIILYSSP